MEARLSLTVMNLAALSLWIVTVYLFTVVAPWTTAIEPNLIPGEKGAEAVEAKWVAAVYEHGVWQHWERGTIAQRPGFFAVHVASLALSGLFAVFLGYRASCLYRSRLQAGAPSA